MPKYLCDPGDPLDMLVEECAEFIQAVMKLRRFGNGGAPGYQGKKPYDEMVQEIGDVLVCIDRLVRFDLTTAEEVEAAKQRKRERLSELFGESY